LCNAGHRVPDDVVRELLNGAYRQVSYHSSDIDSLHDFASYLVYFQQFHAK
jgi:hypothetical protein